MDGEDGDDDSFPSVGERAGSPRRNQRCFDELDDEDGGISADQMHIPAGFSRCNFMSFKSITAASLFFGSIAQLALSRLNRMLFHECEVYHSSTLVKSMV